ncbi:MAG: NAD(P)H-dependent glycerol-3-phosphate dehydrogenase [Solirubrobacteraceae bacterium]
MDKELISARIGLVGAGSWGTAIMKMLTENVEKVNWWVKDEYTKGFIEANGHCPKHLSSIKFNTNQLNITTDINKLIENSDIVILVIPSIYIKTHLDSINHSLENKMFYSAVKGIIPEALLTVSEYLNQVLKVPLENIGNIMGPCHAEEVALQRLSYLTVSAADINEANKMQRMLDCGYIKTIQSTDVLGSEYSAVLKNIYAISCGISHGLGYGDNFQSVLISNSIREIELFLTEVLPNKDRKINNSVYLGDLLVTAYSYFSRNRMFGNMIGKGYTVRSAIMEMNMITEGYYATEGAYKILEKLNLDMTICKAIYDILYKHIDAATVFKKLSIQLT